MEVRRRSEELALKREKEAIWKYKSQYERERKDIEAKLQREFESSIMEVK